MAERFNGRVGSEVLGITVYSHAQLERLLRGFNAAYNARRQRVLDGKTPDQVVAERLRSRRRLARPRPEGAAADARLIAEAGNDVSPPDTWPKAPTSWHQAPCGRRWRRGGLARYVADLAPIANLGGERSC